MGEFRQRECVDVAVVGAGLAGLAAALELSDAGVRSLVLEARDRVGGRTVTETKAGVAVDGGGQYVGPAQLNVISWADRYGIDLCPAYDGGAWLLEVGGRVLRQRGHWPDLAPPAMRELRDAVGLLEDMAAEVPLEQPWQAPEALAWDALTAREWTEQTVRDDAARTFIRLCMEITLAADAHEASLLHMLFMVRSLGGWQSAIWDAQELRLVGGAQALSLGAALELGDRVRLSASVVAITECGAGLELQLADRSTVVATRAIVALPPPLAARLSYDPPLPGRRDQLCQRMPMGTALKAVAFYGKPFWREQDLSGLVVSDAGPVSWLYDNCWPDPSPAMLVGFVTGRAAIELGALPEPERRAAVLAGIARTLGPEALNADGYIDWRWAEEPWSRGCYASYATPGSWTTTGSALRAPVGRIHWAGSDTATEWVGFMDGAIASGRRAAAEVLTAEGIATGAADALKRQ